MVWYNWQFIGNAATPQADDAETSTCIETGETGLSLPFDVGIVDVVTDFTTAQNHEIRIFVNGKAQGSQIFSGQINPATQGRVNFANQGIMIPKGSRIQIKGSQKNGGAAEAFKVQIQFKP